MSNDGWVSVSVMPVLSERLPTDLTIFLSVCGSPKSPRARPRLRIDRSARQQALIQQVQFHHHAPVQYRAPAQPQQFVPRLNPNIIPHGNVYHQHQHAGHARRASYPETPRRQASYQHASPPAAKKPRLKLSVHPDNWPALNPLQYSAEPVQYASSPQPGNTQTTDVANANQPKQTLERREAMGYQRKLED
ncbi:hypothetical protein FRC09_019645 [Ceratobasidium sp. 395]|nr:hypothetical protein FRC09_019645 [Ceratobasidium sp. 395]